jgi:DNA-binding NarL/FixJ family response regulator
VRQHNPELVLLDISLPGQTGLSVASRLLEEMPDIKILILSMHDHARYVVEAVKVGVHGYLLKDAGAEELRKAVAAIQRGTQYFSPGVISHLGAAVRQQPGEAFADVNRLTKRERQVLVNIARGRTNKETARDLGISTRTVETHRESLMRKVDIKTVAGLTRLALEAGLLSE